MAPVLGQGEDGNHKTTRYHIKIKRSRLKKSLEAEQRWKAGHGAPPLNQKRKVIKRRKCPAIPSLTKNSGHPDCDAVVSFFRNTDFFLRKYCEEDDVAFPEPLGLRTLFIMADLYDYPQHFGKEIPVEAILEFDLPLSCHKCNTKIDEFGVWDGADACFCIPCAIAICQNEYLKALTWAESVCRICRELPTYDPSQRWACTPEEYEQGNRESYTKNAYLTRCRHDYTNYDNVISTLNQYSMYDQAKYYAVRETIMELIDAEIESNDLIRVELEDFE